MKKLLLSVLLAFAVSSGVYGVEEKGTFGFKVDVDTSLFTVRTVKIKSVNPGSPAAAQHLNVGDEILEADGHAVPGGKPSELRPIMQKRPGEMLHLKLKRASGESYSVALTAVKRPS